LAHFYEPLNGAVNCTAGTRGQGCQGTSPCCSAAYGPFPACQSCRTVFHCWGVAPAPRPDILFGASSLRHFPLLYFCWYEARVDAILRSANRMVFNQNMAGRSSANHASCPLGFVIHVVKSQFCVRAVLRAFTGRVEPRGATVHPQSV
jgi:hypothetical protein